MLLFMVDGRPAVRAAQKSAKAAENYTAPPPIITADSTAVNTGTSELLYQI
jgi:hypothetical protein